MRKALAVLLAIAVPVVCLAGDDEKKEKEEHKAPHGGLLLEVGEELAHLELVHDPKEGTAKIYVLDGKAEKAVAIKDAPKINLMTEDGAKQLVTKAVEADKEGKASLFEAKDDALKADPLKGRIAVVIGDRKYSVDIEEHAGHEGHDHDHR
ncbi:MAG: hypothetical protein IT452_18910 [Planctomycetia bacterium]|nr:hypothetical protein [Planctomycetia bacterium]